MSLISIPAGLLWLLGGVGAFLALATLIGQILKRRRPQGHAVIANLNARIAAWWVMVALLALAFLAGRAGVVLLFAALAALSLREFLKVTACGRADIWVITGVYAIVLPVQFWAVYIDWYGFYTVFIPVYAFLLMPAVAALAGGSSGFMARAAETQWGLMVCVYGLSHVPAILSLTIPGGEAQHIQLIAWLIFTVQLSDVMQYIWGKLAGRHKLAPELSPSKTWEGMIGGVASAVAVATALWSLTPFSPAGAALMALVVTLMGTLGGLVMSAIKRDKGVKDWGAVIAGHGGFLDRLDSVIFSAPIFFHLTRYYWT
ncbi:phosphatidate cytidylyltransferase [Pararhodobacter zhoushanensis]|uniref:Phosphatidate cytidylyltransferase n=1 Tax=Pararhodobacter zhoushanensis TaxID=2479545 RepID=A0ABT3H3F7_9RHOB|nr:phosphatidate cytidylyltransferase [Pararhodobacter zhoushanensis]MCW1934314.1 phosphatidate cytidylyltransferase [Pararhodobacter zhoushanensis]